LEQYFPKTNLIYFLTIKVVGGEPSLNALLSAKLPKYGCVPKKTRETF